MASSDPAFLWETELLRSTRSAPGTRSEPPRPTMTDGGDWLTLQEASEATGVPAGTIRKWARHKNIPSFLEQTNEGYLRYVSVSGMQDWAAEIGRDIGEVTEIDLDVVEDTGDTTTVPEGSMLVPLDAWNRMLNQLGNLHEAGQQLAEARERAAKAETEARFLKERMSELREELERARASSGTGQPARKTAEPASGLGAMARSAYAGWRRRRRDRS